MLVVFRHANNLRYWTCSRTSASLFAVLHWNNPASYNWLFHIHFRSVQVVGGAVKSLWMRILLWGNECKQYYQPGCRRSCPSPNPGPLSRCYFRILNAETLFLCGSRILKNAQTQMMCLFLQTHSIVVEEFKSLHCVIQDSAVIPLSCIQYILLFKNAANPGT